MEKIIHITVPRTPNEMQQNVIERAKQLHPKWELKVWQDPIAPGGYLLEGYWPKVGSGAQFADLLRLDVLYRYGGVYVDSDLSLIRPLDDLVCNFDFFVASEDGLNLTNALIGARRNSPIVRSIIDDLLQVEPDWSLPPNETTGPKLFARILKWKKGVTVLPRETFYSRNWNEAGSKQVHRAAFGEHLWAASWKEDETVVEEPIVETPSSLAKAKCATKMILRTVIEKAFDISNRVQALNPKKPYIAPFRAWYPAVEEIVVKTIHNFSIVVDGRDISLTPELVSNGYYELPEENFLKNTLRGGDWMIDVGCNVGSFSLLSGQCVGPFGRVFAYDPNPKVHKLLAKSAVMNWMHDRIIPRNVALGDRDGTVNLSFALERLGDGRVEHCDDHASTFENTSNILGDNSISTLEVNLTPLDSEFPINLPIKVLKIDVEGFEGRVLRGARRLLEARCIDFVIVEMLEEVAGRRWFETLEAAEQVISWGYMACTLTPEGSLVEHKNLRTAMKHSGRNVVLAASGTPAKT